jgi:NDP-sugar pyrophosphorylase family protein
MMPALARELRFSTRFWRLLTGGRVKRYAVLHWNSEPFRLTYGDGVADIDLDALLAFHRSHGKMVTVTACASCDYASENYSLKMRR